MIRKTKIKNQKSNMAFTLMELMVSIAILVIIILAVGVTFSGASNAVGTSQATMDEMSVVQAIQAQIEDDLKHLDKNGFLVIRSQVLNPTNTNVLPNSTYLRYCDISPHYDQLSFLASGTYANRTGSDTTSPFSDNTVSNSAHIWWGQLIMEKNGAPLSYEPPREDLYYPNFPPTGVVNNAGTLSVTQESDFMLGHHVMLLVPGPTTDGIHVTTAGRQVAAYPSLDGTTNFTLASTMEAGFAAHITSSRFAVVAQTTAQLMQSITVARGSNTSALGPESMACSYRFRALSSVYDTEVGAQPFVNGYFRTTPQALAGVSSFRVEWTDGQIWGLNVNDPPALAGQLKWYGATTPLGNPNIEAANSNSLTYNGNNTGDNYVATFSYYNKSNWPKALRITMHVYSDRLGGRDFTQIDYLPQ